ncbi:MAG: hypothetical protein COB09_18440 [Thalassobium sp.]|nr:MAG: hypothetical protein COB09_18440 [Thalassobium sp.]
METSFNTEAAKNFFLSIKLIANSRNGFPDRTCFGKGGHIFFVELKRPKEDPRPNQYYWHRLLKRMGFRCYVCKTTDEAKKIFKLERRYQMDSSSIPTKRHRKRVSTK